MITGTETVHLAGRPGPIFIEGRLPLLDAADVVQLGLRDGQIVRPTVEVMGSQLKLSLMGRAWDLAPGWRALAGQWLPVEVRLLPSGGAQLRPLASASRASTPAVAPARGAVTGAVTSPPIGIDAPIAPDRLMQLALRPMNLDAWASLLRPGALAQVARQALASGAGGADDTDALLEALPQMSRMNPGALKAAIQASGLFTERRLAQGGAAAAGPDLKSLLRGWLDRLDRDSGEWAPRIAEAIDDIEAAQLQSTDALQPKDSAQPRDSLLNLVLGFSDHPPVKLSIEREGGAAAPSTAPWIVHVQSTSPAFGEIWLQAALHRDARVELTMWAPDESVCALARTQRAALRSELAIFGLDLDDFRVVQGVRPRREPEPFQSVGQLLDLRA